MRARSTRGPAGASGSSAIFAGSQRRRGSRDPGGTRSSGSGLGGAVRAPGQLASDARGWLLQRGASPIPFFLLVDFRCLEPAGEAGGADDEEAVASLLDHLDQMGLAGRTVVVLAQTGGPRERPLRVVVRPPLAWPGGAARRRRRAPSRRASSGPRSARSRAAMARRRFRFQASWSGARVSSDPTSLALGGMRRGVGCGEWLAGSRLARVCQGSRLWRRG